MKMQSTIPTEGQFVAVWWEGGFLECQAHKWQDGKLYGKFEVNESVGMYDEWYTYENMHRFLAGTVYVVG